MEVSVLWSTRKGKRSDPLRQIRDQRHGESPWSPRSGREHGPEAGDFGPEARVLHEAVALQRLPRARVDLHVQVQLAQHLADPAAERAVLVFVQDQRLLRPGACRHAVRDREPASEPHRAANRCKDYLRRLVGRGRGSGQRCGRRGLARPTHLAQVEETDKGQVEGPEQVVDHPLPHEGKLEEEADHLLHHGDESGVWICPRAPQRATHAVPRGTGEGI